LAVAFCFSVGLFALPGAAQDRSDLTGELDIFAAKYFDWLQPRSIREGIEYCGLFGVDGKGNLAAILAQPGNADSCHLGEAPAGFEVLASWHTHGAYDRDADTEAPSWGDLESDIEEGIDGYIATPGGRLWFNDAVARRSFLICGVGCVIADPDDDTPGALGQKLDNGQGGDTFPAAGFTDQTHGLARFNAEGDSVDRADLAVAREERRLQIANFEQSGH
jgi:hypothetical protein